MTHRLITLSDGKKMPALGFGTGTGGYMQTTDVATEGGRLALELGFRHLDTAQYYETEPQARESIEKAGLKRDDVWVTTKLSNNKVSATTPEIIRAATEESIKNLGSKPDLFLIHNPFVIEDGKLGEAWQILESMVEDGTLSGVSLGVSNFRPQDIEAVLKVAKIKPVINQLEYHPYLLTQLEPLRKLQDEHGIKFQAYGPLTPLLRHPNGGPLKPVLEKIAARLSKDSGKEVDAAGALLLWTVQTGVSAVTTSSKRERVQKLVDVDTLPDLTKEEIDEIEKVGKGVHFRSYTEHMTKDFPKPDLPSYA